jgi:hypothetical protein
MLRPVHPTTCPGSPLQTAANHLQIAVRRLYDEHFALHKSCISCSPRTLASVFLCKYRTSFLSSHFFSVACALCTEKVGGYGGLGRTRRLSAHEIASTLKSPLAKLYENNRFQLHWNQQLRKTGGRGRTGNNNTGLKTGHYTSEEHRLKRFSRLGHTELKRLLSPFLSSIQLQL